MISISRVLNITNGYMVAVGSSAHRYSSVFGTFRLSLLGIASLILINSVYFAALWTHYDHQQQIHLLRLLSQLLHDCVYLHLLIGVINWLVVVLQYRTLLVFASEVAEKTSTILRKDGNNRTDGEWFTYYRMWSNSFVLLLLNAYNLCRMDLRSLTGTRIMLIVGLAFPHLLIADILRFVTVQSVLINAMWSESNRHLKEAEALINDDDNGVVTQSPNCPPSKDFPISLTPVSIHILVHPKTADKNASDLQTLKQILTSFETYKAMYEHLQKLVRYQLCLLITQHSLVIFVAVHIYVKVRLLWHILLTEIDQHLLRINFVTFLAMIVNDYVCLCITTHVCNKQIYQTKRMVISLLNASKFLHHKTLQLLTHFMFRFHHYHYDGIHLLGIFSVNMPNFVMVILMHVIVAAIIGTYQFLNTKIDEVIV